MVFSRLFKTLSAGLLMLLVTALPSACAEISIVPNGFEDMGSGPAAIAHLYTPGGIPGGLGLILGQPNSLTRNDRVLVRFDISKLALYSNPAQRLKKAVLEFRLDSAYLLNTPSKVDVSRLLHDTATGFVGTDMLREPVSVVAKFTVSKPTAKDYSIDITTAVRSDIEKGRKYTAYRWRNVTAEEKGNIFVAPWFIKLIADSPETTPRLTLTFDDGGASK